MKKKKKVAKAPGCPPGKMWHDKTNSCIDDPGYDITVTGRKISMQEENYGPLNMLGVSSPLNNGRDTLTPGRSKWSHLLSNIKAKFKNPDFQKDVSTFLNLASFIPAVRVGKGAHAVGKSFWPQTKNTGDLYAKARARKIAETSTKPKSTKYQKSYHENEILEPKSGYYSSDPSRPGWPMPLPNKRRGWK